MPTTLAEEQAPGKVDSTAALCAHCDAPVVGARGKNLASGELVFCCRGCEFVYHSISKLGLGSYYDLRRKGGTGASPAESSATQRYLFLDSALSQSRYIEKLSAQRARVRFYLAGIHCAACIWMLEKLPQVCRGIDRAQVQFGSGEIEIEFNPETVRLSEIAYTLNALGYPPVPNERLAIDEENRRLNRQMLLRIGVAAVCAANTMMLAVSIFQGFFTGMEEPYAGLFRWLSLLIATPAVLYSAVPFYRSAFGALIAGTLHIDLPIAVAILAAYISGIITTLRGEQYIYFDSATTLIFLLLMGRWIQSRAVARARATALTPWEFLPSSVRQIDPHSPHRIEKPLSELCVGDLIEVLPGERIPSDGVIRSGKTTLDRTFLTGESIPCRAEVGEIVYGGSIVIESALVIEVTKVGSETRLGQLLQQIERTQSVRAQSEDRAQRFSVYFVGAIFIAAIANYIAWSFFNATQAFDTTVALLIVTCPCALGLAIPAAVTVALGRAKRRGILVRRADEFEALAECQSFYFDKTGTLTDGVLAVQNVVSDDGVSLAAARMLALNTPTHPLARAIALHLHKVSEAPLQQVVHHPARGLSGLNESGEIVRLGSPRWIVGEGAEIDTAHEKEMRKLEKTGYSLSLFSCGTKVQAIFALADSLRPEAIDLVRYLHSRGKTVAILSGDSDAAVKSVALRLQIPAHAAHGELYPEQKAEIIKASTTKACMIGDGLNDALAMKCAAVSIGLRGGIEASIEAASIYITSGRIADLNDLIRSADTLGNVINRNMQYAIAYNIVGGVAAVCGYINPLIAAFLMPLNSLTIITSSLLTKVLRR
jgi:P-type Cu2+ transporter